MVAKSIGRHGSKRGMNNYMIHKAKETYVPTVADNEEDFEILARRARLELGEGGGFIGARRDGLVPEAAGDHAVLVHVVAVHEMKCWLEGVAL